MIARLAGSDAGRLALTLAGGAAGGLLFWLLNIPAPWLSGGLVGVVGITAAGIRPRLPDALRDAGMLFAGAVAGSMITPEMLAAAARYPLSLLLLALTTALSVIAGRMVLTRFFGWDQATAFFSAVPGALSAVLATAADRDVDMLKVVAIQSFRLFILVALLPSAVIAAVPHGAPPVPPLLPAAGFAMMMAVSLAAALAMARLGVMAPFLLGGLAAAGFMHVTGAVQGVLPAIVAGMAMLLVGIFAGSRFSTLNYATVKALALPGLAVFAVTSAVSMAGALMTALLVGLPVAVVFVAYAPGGLEAMVMLGIALNLDPLYVSAHHISRFIMIAAAIPIVARRMP